MSTTKEIKNLIAGAVNKEFGLEMDAEAIHLEHPQDESHGDWASNIALGMAKEVQKAPREIAQSLADEINAISKTCKAEVAGPGFINFKIDDSYYKNLLKEIIQNENYGDGEDLKDKRILIEFAHPNPFKAFHIGHLRNIILGESMVRMMEAQGAEVLRVNYQGDVGMHIAKCLWAFRKIDPKDYPKNTDEKVALLGKAYVDGATAFEEDENIKKEIVAINKLIYAGIYKNLKGEDYKMSEEEKKINDLWKLGREWSLEKFREIYERVYSNKFLREYMESETLLRAAENIKKAKEKGILKESQGALIFDGSKYGIDTRVFLNSEGLPTYEGKELGLGPMQFSDFGEIDLAIHNVAVEQISYFKVVIKALELLDPETFEGKIYHNAYEFVGLKSGKMSSRKGKVVLGNDILDEAHQRIKKVIEEKKAKVEDIEETSEIIGIGAVKYSFLKISPFKYLAFDMEESLNFEGNSGPYVQYTYARAKSILRDAKDEVKLSELDLTKVLNGEAELKLLRWLDRFPGTVAQAAAEYSPHYLATYVFELAQRFNIFYKEHPVLIAEDKDERISRLALTHAAAQTIQRALYLMGIKTVEKM